MIFFILTKSVNKHCIKILNMKFIKTIFGGALLIAMFIFFIASIGTGEYFVAIIIIGCLIVLYKFFFGQNKSKTPLNISNKNTSKTIGKYKPGTKCYLKLPIKRPSGEGFSGLIFSNKYVIRFYLELKESYYDEDQKIRYNAYCYHADFGTPGNWASINQINGYDAAHNSVKQLLDKWINKEAFPLETDIYLLD